MRQQVSLLKCLLVVLFIPVTEAQKVGVQSKLGFACFNCALNWTFGCPNVVLPLDCRCQSEDFLTTALDCVVTNSVDMEETYEGWKYIRDQCRYWGNRKMPLREMEEIYNRKYHSHVSPEKYNETSPQPITIPQSMLTKQMVGTKDTKYHYTVASCFAWAIVSYWVVVMLGGIITNGIRIMDPNIYNIFGKGRVTSLRKYLTMPALVSTNHNNPFRISNNISLHVPTRGQTIIIIGFVALNIAGIVSFLGVNGESPLSFTSQSDRKLHYLANRTGIMAFGHIPLIVLFACRNNPLIRLTGWPYDTFMTYHRWCARLMGINAIIHAIAIYWSSINEKVVAYKWHHVHNWKGGNLAAYMVILMLCMSLRRVRAQFYEIFKATHVLMFLIFIICLLVHCSDYGWLPWLYTSLAFYGIEYSARLIKIIMSGGIQKANFRLVDSEMFRVTMPGGKRRWDVKPGSFIYIRILSKDMFWQSHPFTVFQSPTSEVDNSMDLCCKAQLGATRGILQKLITYPDKSMEKNVMVEGPYGNENYVCTYDSVFLFTGGVGFTAMYSFAAHIIKNMRTGQCLNIIWVVKDCGHLSAFEEEIAHLVKNRGQSCRFRIFVTQRDQSKLGTVVYANTATSVEYKEDDPSDTQGPESLKTERKKTLTTEDNAIFSQVSLFDDHHSIQGNSSGDVYGEDSTDCGLEACHIVGEQNSVVDIDYGRPNISAEVSDFIKIASGSKVVCSCGPPMFVDMIRDGIIKSIVDSNARVDYFEDAFSW